MSILDQTKPFYHYFEEITKIPHGSYNEEKLASYIIEFAKENNLKYFSDDMHNVVIFKEATLGYESHETILLQAHIDMVNEKDKTSTHNFECDPLSLYIEDGWLHANGTTLGADNGVGVAYMMSLLADKNAKHPALECAFTVQEEVGLKGAKYLDTSFLKATRMINLDSESEEEMCISSSGAIVEEIYKPYTLEENKNSAYQLEISRLLGGHSGNEIHKYRANSIKLLSRILYHMIQDGINIQLVDIQGGSKKNAIPRNASCIFSSEASIDSIIQSISTCFKAIKQEHKETDPNITIQLLEANSPVCMTIQDTIDIVNYLYLSINGCLEMSQTMKDLPIHSLNLGVIETQDDYIVAYYHIRSPQKSKRLETCSILEGIAKLCHCDYKHFGDYDGWDRDPNSKLRNAYKTFYQEKTGIKVQEYATHGGLETGIFKGKMPQLDIITIGPNMENVHSPSEKLNLDSFENNYYILKEFLEKL